MMIYLTPPIMMYWQSCIIFCIFDEIPVYLQSIRLEPLDEGTRENSSGSLINIYAFALS